MQKQQLRWEQGFDIVAGNAAAQAATMVLLAGETTGGPDNRHEHSDQWLYVVAGEGAAIIDGEEHDLAEGTLLLIEQGEAHEIRNTGGEPLATLNVYVPPAYGQAAR